MAVRLVVVIGSMVAGLGALLVLTTWVGVMETRAEMSPAAAAGAATVIWLLAFAGGVVAGRGATLPDPS